MRNIRTACLLIACFAVASCVVSPLSRTNANSNSPVTLQGYALSNTATVTIKAVNQNTGAIDTLGVATFNGAPITHTTSGGTTYTLYPWTFKAGVLAQNYWSPQSIVADLKTAQGHLELFASDGGANYSTFSPGAAQAAMASGQPLGIASASYSDGNSTVLFDPNGVGFGPEGSWTNVQGMTSTQAGYPSVAWSVGSYTVENGAKKIYGLICAPTSGGPYPVVVYNHGGTGTGDGGNVNGIVTASGWTSQPTNIPDSLGQCLDWAKRGWVFATSSYRGENVNIASSDPAFPKGTWTSDGNVEFCMGEVTDVLALTDLVMNHASSIALGAAGHTVAPNVSSKLLMAGYSHGGCITWRAVEQGAPVTAVINTEAFTDLRLTYLTALASPPLPCQQPPSPFSQQVTAEIASGAYQFGVSTYAPDANGVMGYNWRSAHYFASHGDLAIEKFAAMPILILHGDVDLDAACYNPVPLRQPALFAADIGATNIFVGPPGVTAPTSYPCISGAVGAPLAASLTGPDATCPISFTAMDANDPCMATIPVGQCNALPLPLAAQPNEPQQQHYLVVYHNMDHIDGGLAIKNTFDGFVKKNFGANPGCDGLVGNCASD
jgi:dienelactone hydrolase